MSCPSPNDLKIVDCEEPQEEEKLDDNYSIKGQKMYDRGKEIAKVLARKGNKILIQYTCKNPKIRGIIDEVVIT